MNKNNLIGLFIGFAIGSIIVCVIASFLGMYNKMSLTCVTNPSLRETSSFILGMMGDQPDIDTKAYVNDINSNNTKVCTNFDTSKIFS